MLRFVTALTILAMLTTRGLAADAGFAIGDGDRVVFLGDSITEQRLYTTYIEAYAVTRMPKANIKFANVGWGGDTAWLRMRSHIDEDALFAAKDEEQQKLVEKAVDRCLARDVISFKPTLVTVNFGMNDHGYQAFRPDIFAAHVRSQARIAALLTKAGSRTAFLTPQPIECRTADPSTDPRNQSIRKFADGLKDVAARNSATFINQFDPYMAILKREHGKSDAANVGGGDEVHPGPVGHTIMAAIILKQLDATAEVSSAEIDVADPKAPKLLASAKCSVTNIKFEKDVLSFDRADNSLPMPIDERAMDALKLAPILDDLSRYDLKITGLSADRYDVVIDDEPAATVTRQELVRGWSHAMTAGPITRQAREVLALIFKKNQAGLTLWEAQIRPKRKAELPGLQKQVEDLEARITAACQPKPHHFQLKPASK